MVEEGGLSELGKILIVVIVFIILIFGIIFLLSGKGGEVLDSIRNLLRFGR
jgi:hypothetical protein